MTNSVIDAQPEQIRFFNPAQTLVEFRETVRGKQALLEQKKAKLNRAFYIVQSAFCVFLALKWSLQGHYIGGPILALIVWCALCALMPLVSLFAKQEKSAVEQSQQAQSELELSTAKAFMASANLGPYRWVSRGISVLGIYPEQRILYFFNLNSGGRHVLLSAQDSVIQVRVEEKTTSAETTVSETQYGRKMAYGLTNNIGVIGKGKATTTSKTSVSVSSTYELHMQYQLKGQEPQWLSWYFGRGWQNAENWRVLILQAAGKTD